MKTINNYKVALSKLTLTLTISTLSSMGHAQDSAKCTLIRNEITKLVSANNELKLEEKIEKYRNEYVKLLEKPYATIVSQGYSEGTIQAQRQI